MFEDCENRGVFKKAVERGLDFLATPIRPITFTSTVLLAISGLYAFNSIALRDKERSIKREKDIKNILSQIDSNGETYNGNIAAKESEYQPLISGVATFKKKLIGVETFPDIYKSDLTRHIFAGLVSDISNELKNVKEITRLTDQENENFDRAILATQELAKKMDETSLLILYKTGELQRTEKYLFQAVDRFIEHDTESYVIYFKKYKDDDESGL